MGKQLKMHHNRRHKIRHSCNNLPVTWRKSRVTPWHDATLHDTSAEGLSILMEPNSLPKIGNHIELLARQKNQRVTCKVVRAEPWSTHKTLLAMEFIARDKGQNMLQSASKGHKGRKKSRRQ